MTGMEPIAHIHTDLPQKFGIPRNSFLAPHLQGRIVFEPEFASNAAVEGLDSFSHLWLLWRFENGTPGGARRRISPPMPRRRTGPAPTPSGRRPCVRRAWVEQSAWACLPRAVRFAPIPSVLPASNSIVSSLPTTALFHHVLGADLRDGTPIYDIKPYIPFADCHPDATGGWIEDAPWQELDIEFPQALQEMIPPAKAPRLGRGPSPRSAPRGQQARAKPRVPSGLRRARHIVYG